MKKSILAITIFLIAMLNITGCNRSMISQTNTYDWAIISLPNGEIIEGTVDSWRQYFDEDQIQIKICGEIYLVHSSDIVLIYKDKESDDR